MIRILPSRTKVTSVNLKNFYRKLKEIKLSSLSAPPKGNENRTKKRKTKTFPQKTLHQKFMKEIKMNSHKIENPKHHST